MIFGVALVVVSVAGLLLATKAVRTFGDALDAHTALLNTHGDRLLRGHELAFQIGTLVVGLLLAALGVRWLATHLPPVRSQRDAAVPNSADAQLPGRNVVAGSALSRALQAQLEASPLVRRARAEVGAPDDPIRLRLDIDESTPVPDVLSQVVQPALRRLDAILGREDVQPIIDIRPIHLTSSRVE
ncbi:MAG TPA: hypothetical protein VGO03_13770 [Acidimicrobiia bacterium]